MITLQNDITALMVWSIEKGYTFMVSRTGSNNPEIGVYFAYMPKLCDNRSLRLYLKSEGVLYRCADENDGYIEWEAKDIEAMKEYACDWLEGEKKN